MGKDTWKVIWTVQLHISHQMRPYSSRKTVWGSGCRVFWALGQFGETGLKYLKSWAESHPKCLTPHFSSNETLIMNVKAIRGLNYTCFSVIGDWGNLGKLGPKAPNHEGGYTESDTKSITPHFTSNEVLFKCKGHLRVDLYLF